MMFVDPCLPLYKRFAVALCLGVLIGTVFGVGPHVFADQADRPTCALVKLDKSPVAALIEAELLGDPVANWLERTEIERLLKEQQLDALLGADAGTGRVRLGQLLKAKVLVFLHGGEQNKVKYLRAIVCETDRGLRLLNRNVPLTADTEADAEAIVQLIHKAIERRGQRNSNIYAVPPFVSQDLTHENDHLKAAYAKLVEETLLDRPGLLVVELAEAEAIAREAKLAGDRSPLRRQLPLYVLGDYRTLRSVDNGQTRTALTLKIRRGEQLIKTVTKTLPADEVPRFLLATAGKLVQQDSSVARVANPAIEAKQLASRSQDFSRLGNWAEALALAEASLLLKPDQPAMRRDAMLALNQVWEFAGWLDTVSELRGKLQGQLRALEHLRVLISDKNALMGYWKTRNFEFIESLFRETHVRRLRNPELRHVELPDDVRELRERLEREEREIAMQLSRWFTQQRLGHASIWYLLRAIPDLQPRQQYATRAELIIAHQDAPNVAKWVRDVAHGGFTVERLDSVEGREFLDSLATSPAASATVRQTATAIRRELEAEVAERYAPPAVVKRSETAVPTGPTRVSFRPLEIDVVPSVGRAYKMKLFSHLLKADGFDIVADARTLGVMKVPGRVKPIWTSQGKLHIVDVTYDGRYVWASLATGRHDPAKLLVADPKSAQVWEVTEQHGLPVLLGDEAPRRSILPLMRTSPLAPGKVCVAGGFGRGWVAIVALENGRPRVDLFHEAREVVNRDDKEAWQRTTLAFYPKAILTLSEQPKADGQQRQTVIIERGGECPSFHAHPLIVDPVRRTVEVLAKNWRDSSSGDVVSDALYQVLPHDIFAVKKRLHLFRTAAPDFTPEPVLQDVNDGIVVFSGGQVNIVGKQWWVGKLTDEKLTCAGDVPWTYWNKFGPAAEIDLTQQYYLLRQIFQSSMYGLVACYYDPVSNEQIIARVVFESTGEAVPSSDETVTTASATKAEPAVTRNEIRRQPVSRFYAASGTAAARTLRQHLGSWNTSLALSADGKTLVTGPSPQVWNTSDGRYLGSFFIKDEVKALSLSGDGHWLAAGTRSGGVHIWQMSTTQPARVLAGHAGRLLDMEFSADGKWLATISGDRSLRLWDVKTATEVFRLPLQHNSYKTVAFSPDGRLLAASGGRGTEFYDVRTGICNHRTETLATLVGFISDGSAVGIAADGSGSLIAWDPRTRVSRELLSSPGGEVMAVDRSGNYIAVRELGTLADDRIVNSKRLVVWGLETASKVDLASPPVNVAVAAAFSRDGNTLVVASDGGRVRLWNPATGRELIAPTQTPQGPKK